MQQLGAWRTLSALVLAVALAGCGTRHAIALCVHEPVPPPRRRRRLPTDLPGSRPAPCSPAAPARTPWP